MLRGSGYAIAEIFFWMIAAAVLGGAVGWTLRRWLGQRRLVRDHEAALIAGRAERDRLGTELSACRADLASQDARIEELTAELGSMRRAESPAAAGSLPDPVESPSPAGDDAEAVSPGTGTGADGFSPVEAHGSELERIRQERDRLIADVEELAAVVADLEGRLAERGD